MSLGAAASRQGAIVFSTAEVAPRDRLAAWNAAFGRLNEIVLPERAAPALVVGSHWELGGLVVSRNRITPARFERDARRVRQDELDHWVIRVLRQGENRVRHDRFSARLQPGEALLFSLRDTWSSVWSEADWVSVTLPRALCPELTRGLAARPPGPLRDAVGSSLATALATLSEQLAAAAPEELPALADGLHGLLAGCFLNGSPMGNQAGQRRRAREAIRRRMASARLNPASLAAELGLSRSALYRLFEAEGGVAREIQAIRLAHARAALCDPARRHESVSSIAACHGFPDPTVFSRSFSRAFGVPPGLLRTAAATATPREIVLPSSDLSARLYVAPATARLES